MRWPPEEPLSLAEAGSSVFQRKKIHNILLSGMQLCLHHIILSLILEAGITPPFLPSPSPLSAPPPLPCKSSSTDPAEELKLERIAGSRADTDAAPDNSVDLSTAQLTNRVIDTILVEESNTARHYRCQRQRSRALARAFYTCFPKLRCR